MIDTKALRKRFGLTQVEFAALLGISRGSVLRAEQGAPIPGLLAALLLIDRFGDEAVATLRQAQEQANDVSP